MAFGKHAFETRLGTISGKYAVPQGHNYSDEFMAIIDWCLTLKPKKRPTSHQVLQYAEEITGTRPDKTSRTYVKRAYPPGFGSGDTSSEEEEDSSDDDDLAKATANIQIDPNDKHGKFRGRYKRRGSSASVNNNSKETVVKEVDTAKKIAARERRRNRRRNSGGRKSMGLGGIGNGMQLPLNMSGNGSDAPVGAAVEAPPVPTDANELNLFDDFDNAAPSTSRSESWSSFGNTADVAQLGRAESAASNFSDAFTPFDASMGNVGVSTEGASSLAPKSSDATSAIMSAFSKPANLPMNGGMNMSMGMDAGMGMNMGMGMTQQQVMMMQQQQMMVQQQQMTNPFGSPLKRQNTSGDMGQGGNTFF